MLAMTEMTGVAQRFAKALQSAERGVAPGDGEGRGAATVRYAVSLAFRRASMPDDDRCARGWALWSLRRPGADEAAAMAVLTLLRPGAGDDAAGAPVAGLWEWLFETPPPESGPPPGLACQAAMALLDRAGEAFSGSAASTAQLGVALAEWDEAWTRVIRICGGAGQGSAGPDRGGPDRSAVRES